MNFQLLKTDLHGASAEHHAAVLVEAAAMLTKVRDDNFVTGSALQTAVCEVGGSIEDAENFYNIIEDIGNTLASQTKRMIKEVDARLGAEAAATFKRRTELHEQGLRLILVALARKVDLDFKDKARALREGLYGARDAVPDAVTALRQEDEQAARLGVPSPERDYDVIETRASYLSMSMLGW